MASSQLIQYVVIRSDLKSVLQWPFGALMAQACHACTAVTHMFYNDPNTQAYLAELDRMHKVVLEVIIRVHFKMKKKLDLFVRF